MHFTQHIEADNLSSDFLDYVKKMFKGKKIKLTIETELDDTAYLMASEANHQRLLKSMKSAKNRDKLVKLDKQAMKKLLA